MNLRESPLVFKTLELNQTAYSVIRGACPPKSPARRAHLLSPSHSIPPSPKSVLNRFTTYPGLLSSHQLEGDTWCNQPDLQALYETFMRPVGFSWTEDIVPIFSATKMRGFADILLPVEMGNVYASEDDTPFRLKERLVHFQFN